VARNGTADSCPVGSQKTSQKGDEVTVAVSLGWVPKSVRLGSKIGQGDGPATAGRHRQPLQRAHIARLETDRGPGSSGASAAAG
jgi:hypothetical protein